MTRSSLTLDLQTLAFLPSGLLLLALSCSLDTPPKSPRHQVTLDRYESHVASMTSTADGTQNGQGSAEPSTDHLAMAEEDVIETTVAETPDIVTDRVPKPNDDALPQTDSPDAAPVKTGQPPDSVPSAQPDDRREAATVVSDEDAILRAEAIAGYDLLYFSARWCAACRRQAAIVDELRRDGYRIRTVDVDRQAAIATAFNISAIPAYAAAANGQVIVDEAGRPRISHGVSTRAGSGISRPDKQAIIALFADSRRPEETPNQTVSTSRVAGRADLKAIVTAHDSRRFPAYVGHIGNLNRHDYLDHLVREHGFSAEHLANWTAFELFQLHSAIHCPSCRRKVGTVN